MSGVINGWFAHVGSASCGHTLGERMSMCGGVFREPHHLVSVSTNYLTSIWTCLKLLFFSLICSTGSLLMTVYSPIFRGPRSVLVCQLVWR